MGAQLVAIDGPLRGSVWAIGDAGLTLGRDPLCNVCLHDSLASRKHCRLFWNDGRLELKDLGARNPVLIAGEARRDGIVRIGETLAIGAELFLVSGDTAGVGHSIDSEMDETLSLGTYLSLHLPGDQTIHLEKRLSTVEQLAFIFEAASEMGACETEEALFAVMRARIESRLAPARFWLARPCHNRKPSFYTVGGNTDRTRPQDFPDAAQSAICADKPLFVPGDESAGAVLVAPMKIASRSLGALVLQAGERSYRKSDLRLVQLFATVSAAFLHSLQTQAQLLRDNERLRMRAGESLEFVGDTPAAQAVREQAVRAARSDLNVLVLGETGTGKELIARLIHRESSRASAPFVAINCAAIPDQLFESQIFGHVKGAFTGAHADFNGMMAQADGGTLFLDEIGDLSLSNQARILGAIECGTFRRLGAQEETRVDIRAIAATNKDLHAGLAEGTFRADLYHRLNGFEIAIPPLRHRKADIRMLANYFLKLGRGQARQPIEGISEAAMAHLGAQTWPGNVRELRNCVLRAISLTESEYLTVADVNLPDSAWDRNPAHTRPSLKEAEKRYIKDILRETGNNVRVAAERLGVSRSTLYKKITDLGIDI